MQKTVRVSSDAWVGSGNNKNHGDDEQLKVRTATQVAMVWAKVPWDRETEVNVTGHDLMLICDGGSVGTADIVIQALSKRFNDEDVTWDTQPATHGATFSVTVADLEDGEAVVIPAQALGSAIAAGAANRGVMITTTSATTIKFHSADAPYADRPRWKSTWTEKPEAPNLRPAGGIISAQFPTWAYDYDQDDEGDLDAVRVQMDPASDGVSPDFDSGSFTTSEAELHTADTTTPAYPGLADGATISGRGTITVGGVESDFGPWATVQRIAKGTIVADSPSAGVVTSPTPTILATFTPADGVEPLTAQRVQIWDAEKQTRLYNDRRKAPVDANTIAADIPFRDPRTGERILRRKTETYQLRIQGWGYEDRVDAPGDPADVEIWVPITVGEASLAAPTGLTVTTIEGRPTLAIAFTIAPDAPDQIAVSIDDEIVEVLEPEDVTVGGTSYVFEYAGAKPRTDVVVKVAQIKDGDMGPWCSPVTGQLRPEGVWLVDPKTGDMFHLSGLDVSSWKFADQAITYDPPGLPYQVRVILSQRGMEGTFTGDLRAAAGLTFDEQLAAAWRMKGQPTRTMRLVADWLSIPVKVDDLSPSVHPDSFPEQPAALTSFAFRQFGERPFRARI